MDKIWIIKRKGSTARNFTIFKKESDLLKKLRPLDNIEVFEYNLESKLTAKDYLLQRERDLQIRNILNELNDDEKLINDFLNNYEQFAPEGKKYKNFYGDKRTEKNDWIDQIKKCNTKKDLAKKLIDNKKYFLTLSTEVDWYISILKIHNFRNYNYINRYYSSKEKKWILNDIPEDIKNNFKIAKKNLKNEKNNK